MKRFDGKVAIVTGAARGIGAATARLLASDGAQVVLTDVLADEGQALADDLGPSAHFMMHDVRLERDWEDVTAAAVQRFGSLSILVNNAGIVKFGTATHECSEADYRQVIDVNQIGVFLGMRTVVGPMTRSGGGSIVNVSSAAGLVGSPGLLPYVASKWAVTGMTKAAAIDLGPFGIRVNSVHPGVIDTTIYSGLPGEIWTETEKATRTLPIGRAAQASEIAEMIAFVASDAASFSSGAAFTADGGWTAA